MFTVEEAGLGLEVVAVVGHEVCREGGLDGDGGGAGAGGRGRGLGYEMLGGVLLDGVVLLEELRLSLAISA